MQFADVTTRPDDPILNLSRLYHEDTRSNKIDVGVGVYQNQAGETPVMAAVKAAERVLLDTQPSKKYLGLTGNEGFNAAIARLVLGDRVDMARVRVNQSIAGTGALSLIATTLASIHPDATVWVPNPTWGNHMPIFRHAGFAVEQYAYYDTEQSQLDRDGLFACLSRLGNQDIVVLHGCCHNPTGEDLTRDDWHKIADFANQRGFLPVVDLAYLGFGDGLEADAYGVRYLAGQVDTVFIANSCSKNFGLYRDRVGAVIAVAQNANTATALQSQLCHYSRILISMPADHGAAVVAEILNTNGLRQQWSDELHAMNRSIHTQRHTLADALYAASGRDWSFITRQRGMFSLLPLDKERVQKLREDYGIYLVGAGRMNIAGLRDNPQAIDYMAKAITEVF